MSGDQKQTSASPYDLLGVSPMDDFSTIRAAWKQLIQTWHPDVWRGSHKEATLRMMAVNDAFDTITKLHKRVQEEAEKTRQPAPRRPEPRHQAQPQPETGQPRVPVQARRANQPIRQIRRRPEQDKFDAAKVVFQDKTRAQMQAVM